MDEKQRLKYHVFEKLLGINLVFFSIAASCLFLCLDSTLFNQCTTSVLYKDKMYFIGNLLHTTYQSAFHIRNCLINNKQPFCQKKWLFYLNSIFF